MPNPLMQRANAGFPQVGIVHARPFNIASSWKADEPEPQPMLRSLCTWGTPCMGPVHCYSLGVQVLQQVQ